MSRGRRHSPPNRSRPSLRLRSPAAASCRAVDDMFATNARLLGRTFEYDGNPHTFADYSQVRKRAWARDEGMA